MQPKPQLTKAPPGRPWRSQAVLPLAPTGGRSLEHLGPGEGTVRRGPHMGRELSRPAGQWG